MRTFLFALVFASMTACGNFEGTNFSESKSSVGHGSHPDPGFTPGMLCSPSDPNFSTYRYPEHIAYCNRNVPHEEKLAIAQEYGISTSDFASYEFDHYIPLAIGGNDNIKNIWPQPLSEAHQKDALEQDLFNKLSAGAMTQAEAVAQIRAWKPQ